MKYRYSLLAVACNMALCPIAFADVATENTKELNTDEVIQEIMDLRSELERQKDESVQFNGYMRAGFATNEHGSAGNDSRMQVPNSRGFFRLGAAENNYTAWNVNKKINTDNGAWARVFLGMAYEDREARRWVYDTQGDAAFMDKMYAEMGNLDFAPDATFWAGRVNYGWDIHILDQKYYEIRSPGMGMKNQPLGNGTVDMYLISHDTAPDSEFDDADGNSITYPNDAKPRTHTFGMEYKEGPWWFAGSLQSNSNGTEYRLKDRLDGVHTVKPAQNGADLMVNYAGSSFLGLGEGSTRIVGQVGTGTAAAILGRHGDTGQSNEGGLAYRGIVDGVWDLGRWQVNTVLVGQVDEDVMFDGHKQQELSVGARPMYQVTDNFVMQFEVGHVATSFENQSDKESGGLTTLTVAPTIKLNANSFFSRPEIRTYATYANYSGDYNAGGLEGYSGDDQDAWMFGVQLEAWF
ncbi:carbohydrate porin [Vibrio ulleungensis]|uniref:Carbohydrate porin n=1 Tax=Vibrio ulleungensis TaxID=2807619 RepID=A0ABS2HG76_9VIBR|nr:carbohydrate porin [Vibrio ulleungensis]MBM7036069.1 carbohydrate porin [Vibrio ulleungensis]